MSLRMTTDVIIDFNGVPLTTETPKSTVELPKIIEEPQKTDKNQLIREKPHKTTAVLPKPTKDSQKEKATHTILGRIKSFINTTIGLLFCNHRYRQEGSKPSVFVGEEFLEDSLFKPFRAKYKREELLTKIKVTFDENKETLRINNECLYGIEDGKIPAEHIIEQFQSLDSERKNLVFLWSSYVKRYDLLAPLFKINANIHSTIPNIGYNGLHLAALSGCVKSCEWLISKGIDLNLTVGGVSPLHCAIIGNSLNCTKLLLSQGAALDSTVITLAFEDHATNCLQYLLNEYVGRNAVDENGPNESHAPAKRVMDKCLQIMISYFPKADLKSTTTLHLAAGNNLFECCQFLLEGGADPNAADHKGRTALHFAAKARSSECLRTLLQAGSKVNVKDVDGRTPLHVAVSGWNPYSPALDVLKHLVKGEADVNASDNLGMTALHNAADNIAGLRDCPSCVDYLIMSGANVTARSHDGTSALSIIRRKTPGCIDALRRKLDSTIYFWHSEFNKQNVWLVFNFLYILGNSTVERMRFLKTLEEEGQKHLIEHPLCQAFLFLHWQRIRKFYLCRIFLWLVFVLLLTAYVIYALAHKCYNAAILTEVCKVCLNNFIVSNKSGEKIPTKAYEMTLDIFTIWNNSSKNIFTEALEKCKDNSSMEDNVAQINATEASQLCLKTPFVGSFLIGRLHFIQSSWQVLALMAIFKSFQKISIMLCQRFNKHFFQLKDIFEWLLIVGVFLISRSWYGRIYDWQTSIGGIAVLLAWVGFMIMIGQLPIFGTYVAMFTRVQKEFLKLLFVYSSLLIGFTASLCVFFPSDNSFDSPLTGFVKMLAMMTGESDFEMLEENLDSNPSSLLDISAYITYMLALIFVTVVVMTLLTGIAVDDIRGLHKTACISKLIRQMELVYFLEVAIHRSFLPKRIVRLLLTFLWKGLPVETDFETFNRFDDQLPKKVLMAASNIAEEKEKRNDSTSCWSNTLKSRLDSISNRNEKNLWGEFRQLKETVSKLLMNSVSEERFTKLETNLYEELQQLKEMVRALNGTEVPKSLK